MRVGRLLDSDLIPPTSQTSIELSESILYSPVPVSSLFIDRSLGASGLASIWAGNPPRSRDGRSTAASRGHRVIPRDTASYLSLANLSLKTRRHVCTRATTGDYQVYPRIGSREISSLLPPSSPPRRYSIPSDSEDEQEESDEDEMESRSDVFEYNPHQHIDLTGLSDDSKSSQDNEDTDEGIEYNEDTDEGIECVGFGFSRDAYDEESISGSDMSESEFEEETSKVITPPGGMSHSDLFGAMGPSPPSGVTTPVPAPISANPSLHGLITPPVELVAPAPISLPRLPRIATLSCLEFPEVGFYNSLPLPDFARHHMEVNSRGPGLDFGYGAMEEVRSGPSMGSHQGGNQVGREHEEIQSHMHLEPEPSQTIQEPTVQTNHAAQASEEVRTLKAELAVAQNEIAELKRSLVEKEAAVVAAAEPPA
ncbi:hypothetical protein RSAG8_04473, partial [Rhizoctonia solani AG-8 WAC10335]